MVFYMVYYMVFYMVYYIVFYMVYSGGSLCTPPYHIWGGGAPSNTKYIGIHI